MNKIEFGELHIGGTARKNLIEVCNSHWASMGPKVKEFETKFKNLFGYDHCSMVSSGTSADIAALLTLYDFGAQPGDEVICPALAFIAVANSIRAAGFKPVFVDVKLDTLNIDESLIESFITPKTRAILAVNTMGKPCEMLTLRNLADKYGLKLIVDNCEAHGCRYNSHFMSAFGDMATYSFYTAHLVVAGEGGAVCSQNKEINDIIKSVRSHGREPDSLYFDHVRFGLNLKPNDLEASLGLESLDSFWDTFNTRKKNYYIFWEVCEPYLDRVYISQEERNCDNSPHAFSITLKENNKNAFKVLTDTFDDYNIHWKRNFGSMPTQHKCFEYLGHKLGEFPNSEHIGDMGLHFTLSQYLSADDRSRIVECLDECLMAI